MQKSAEDLQLDLSFDPFASGETVALFKLYIQYIYTGRLPFLVKNGSADRTSGNSKLVDLYLLAQQVEDSEAMDTVVSSLLARYLKAFIDDDGQEYSGLLPCFVSVEKAYSNTPTSSSLRRLMVDMYVLGARGSTLLGDMPFQFVLDVARAALNTQQDSKAEDRGDAAQISCCHYHEHDKQAACPSRRRKREGNSGGGKQYEDDEDDGDSESYGNGVCDYGK